MRTLLASALLAACTASNAAELPRDVLGLTLGAPLNLPECPAGASVEWVFDESNDEDAEPCIERGVLPSADPANDVVELRNIATPSWARSASASLRDGVLAGVSISTAGELRQDDVLAALVEKYGPPHTEQVEVLRNGLGQEFASQTASWSDGDLKVTMLGIDDRRDRGVVVIDTQLDRDAAAREREERRARDVRL